MDKVTNTIAGAAAVSPWWLPSLADISQGAGLLLPVAGLVWLLIQIWFKIKWGR